MIKPCSVFCAMSSLKAISLVWFFRRFEMKITSPISHIDEIEALVSAGAKEIYCRSR
jgi:hypothetical protein